ncbi:hypothetical protein STAQ_44500 [Allostella sp. ATCC 35155]|nr:hypothetical protein STAQ_44500 [Stella sp. ATCC 35155]
MSLLPTLPIAVLLIAALVPVVAAAGEPSATPAAAPHRIAGRIDLLPGGQIAHWRRVQAPLAPSPSDRLRAGHRRPPAAVPPDAFMERRFSSRQR